MSHSSRGFPRAFSGSEALAASKIAALAGVIVSAYLIDRAGGSFPPLLMLALTIGIGVSTFVALAGRAAWDVADTSAFAVIVVATFGWLLWMARPTFLPLGTGPDLTHHILLIQYVERHWRLVHGPGVEDYLGEMVYYTPGSHVLAALAGAWLRSTGFHVLHGVMSATVALKAGLVYLVAKRMLPDAAPRVPLAMLAALALLAAQTYFLGSFIDFSFLAQVVAELFAVAMWWQLIVWSERPGLALSLLVGVTGAALFLTWPIFVGPPLILLGVLALMHPRESMVPRLVQASVTAIPIAIVAGLFIAGRTGMMVIAGTGGRAAWPTVAAYGWPLLTTSVIGILVAASRPATRSIAIFVGAIALQAAVLYWFARSHGNEPYMALKMFYLLLYPQAVAASVTCGAVWVRLTTLAEARSGFVTSVPGPDREQPTGARAAVHGCGTARRWAPARGHPLRGNETAPKEIRKPNALYAWIVVALVGLFVGRPLAHAPQSLSVPHRPAASRPLEQAGEWARAHVPPRCVEYLVADDETAYWLHLAVLGNARQGARTADNSTYELTPTLVRWLTPGGLPYAIVDLPAIPAGVRDDLDVVQRFGSAAVAKRRGPSSCDAQ